MAFQQAGIAIDKQQEFGLLKSAIERVFSPPNVEKLLKKLDAKGIRIRDTERVLSSKVLEALDPTLASSGQTSRGLYDALTLSDKAQLREFYLLTLEAVDDSLRAKYARIYRYY